MNIILTLRTDRAEAEVDLFSFDNGRQLNYTRWHADRNLAKELLGVIHQQLKAQDADWDDLSHVVVYTGPGSFTGLRIGITVANTLAYGLKIPIVGAETPDWRIDGIERVAKGEDDKIVMPHYGAEANITLPKK